MIVELKKTKITKSIFSQIQICKLEGINNLTPLGIVRLPKNHPMIIMYDEANNDIYKYWNFKTVEKKDNILIVKLHNNYVDIQYKGQETERYYNLLLDLKAKSQSLPQIFV